ncbi:hypothetical protein EDB87DRAFT_1577329 [Lactarius vividus]|nr:hypothetical protein EDB87DRAFT_1577329 [Lactarius vividus]
MASGVTHTVLANDARKRHRGSLELRAFRSGDRERGFPMKGPSVSSTNPSQSPEPLDDDQRNANPDGVPIGLLMARQPGAEKRCQVDPRSEKQGGALIRARDGSSHEGALVDGGATLGYGEDEELRPERLEVGSMTETKKRPRETRKTTTDQSELSEVPEAETCTERLLMAKPVLAFAVQLQRRNNSPVGFIPVDEPDDGIHVGPTSRFEGTPGKKGTASSESTDPGNGLPKVASDEGTA